MASRHRSDARCLNSPPVGQWQCVVEADGRPVAHSLDPRRRLHTCVTAASVVVGSLIASRRPALPAPYYETDRQTERPSRPAGRLGPMWARHHLTYAAAAARSTAGDNFSLSWSHLVRLVRLSIRPTSSCLLQRLLIFVHASHTIYTVCPQ